MKETTRKPRAKKTSVAEALAPPRPAAKRSRAKPIVHVEAFPAVMTDAVEPALAARPPKRVRVRLRMPREDYDLLKGLKARASEFDRPARKSEVLRAGLHALTQATSEEFRALLDALAPMGKKQGGA